MELKFLLRNSRKRIILIALASFVVNIIYALGNFALGIFAKSYWFLTMGAYNLILAIMRFSVLVLNEQKQKEISERFIQRFIGIMIILLACILCGSVYLSINFDVARNFHEIIMITIATYTFAKIIFAIINYIKKENYNSHIISTLRCITLCDAVVAIYTMQKSMLVSFGEMSVDNIRLMNILSGIGMIAVISVLGILLIIKSKKEYKNG